MIPWLVRPGDILLVGVLTTTPPTHQMGPAYIDENGTRSDTVQDKVNVPRDVLVHNNTLLASSWCLCAYYARTIVLIILASMHNMHTLVRVE